MDKNESFNFKEELLKFIESRKDIILVDELKFLLENDEYCYYTCVQLVEENFTLPEIIHNKIILENNEWTKKYVEIINKRNKKICKK